MTPKQLTQYLEFAITNKEPVLIKSGPGVGKTAIVKQVCKKLGVNLILSHPTISEPTDYKGLPFAVGGKAEFLPYGDLRKLIEAEVPTVCFFDDIGQSSTMTQASLMQILWGGQIGNHSVSEHVSFIGATNRKEDMAGVSGLLEPVKSRFGGGIIELEVNSKDWCSWAIDNRMPVELIAFIRFRPDLLDNAKPSKDIINTASPRTVAAVGNLQNKGLMKELEFEVFKGVAGEAFAAEYMGFLKLYRELPSIDDIILNPDSAVVPKDVGAKYAISTAIASHATVDNIASVLTYIKRLPKEHEIACIQDINYRNKEATRNTAFIKRLTEITGVLL